MFLLCSVCFCSDGRAERKEVVRPMSPVEALFLFAPQKLRSATVPWFLTGAKHMHQIIGTQIRAQNQYGTGSREGPVTQT